MADDLKQTGKPDDARINVEEEQHEVRYSADLHETLQCSPRN